MRLLLPSIRLFAVHPAFWLAIEALNELCILVALFTLMHMLTRAQVWEMDFKKLIEILPDVTGCLVFVSDSSECIVL